MQKIKDLILRAQVNCGFNDRFVKVVMVIAIVVVSRCCFAEGSTELFKVRAARAARLVVIVRPIKFLTCSVVVDVDVVDVKAPNEMSQRVTVFSFLKS